MFVFSPWALLAVPLVLVHLWPRRRRLVIVPAVFLWRQAIESDRWRGWRRRCRRWASLGVDLVALVLIVAAINEPGTEQATKVALGTAARTVWAAAALGVLAVSGAAELWHAVSIGSRPWLALRASLLLALAAALFRPTVAGSPRPIYPVFLIDRSASVSPAAFEKGRDFVARAVAEQEHWAEVFFAEIPWLAESDRPEPPSTVRLATDLAAVLALGCRMAPSDRAPHLILLSDGIATQGDLETAIDAARRAGIPVSTVPLDSCDPEVYVSAVQTPQAARAGEPFEMAVALWSSREGEGYLDVALASGATAPNTSGALAKQRVVVERGTTWHTLRLALENPPSARLVVRLGGFSDTLAENNAMEIAATVLPRRRVLLVSDQPGSAEHLDRALRGGNFAVEVRAPKSLPDTLAAVQAFDAVALINVPAEAIAPRQMELFDSYVRGGGGLLAVGGDRAFVRGGYRNSRLEAILPVESEPSRKTPRPSLALVFVVDRSQSMEDSGAIRLSREAMRQAVRMLNPDDQLGLLVFDEESRWIRGIEPVGDKTQVLARIDSIVAGGRTDMGPALHKAYLALRESFADAKHIVVLSDGISHPADFEALAEQMARDEITLSTIALGKEASRPLLADMARRGKGRAYVCDRLEAIPQVVVTETARAILWGIREEPFAVKFLPPTSDGTLGQHNARARFSFLGIDPKRVPPLLGYAETRLKPRAVATLVAADGDPLLAWQQVGRGVSAVFTSDVEDCWAAAWLTWPDFGRFWTLVLGGVMPIEAEPRTVLAQPLVSFPDELRIRAADRALLQRIAATTGGTYEPEPEDVWHLADPGTLPPTPLAGWLLAAAALLLVPDAAARRTFTA